METYQISNIEEDKGVSANFNRRWPRILEAYPRIINSHAGMTQKNGNKTQPTFEALATLYKTITIRLRNKYSVNHIVTDSEAQFKKVFNTQSKLQIIQSFWIGNRCVDFFLSQVGQYKALNISDQRYFGVAIEIDGSIHDKSFKQKKDASKIEFLSRAGIQVISIKNSDVKKPIIKKIIAEISEYPRLDTRAKKRVWLRIYLLTIAAHATDAEYAALFQIPNNSYSTN